MKHIFWILIIILNFSTFSFAQERKIEKKVYSNFREGKLDVALTELDNLKDKYTDKSFFYYWKAFIHMEKISQMKKFDYTEINQDSASYHIEKSLGFLIEASKYLTPEQVSIDKEEFGVLFPGCDVIPPNGEKKYTNCEDLIKDDFKVKKDVLRDLQYNLSLRKLVQECKKGERDITKFLKEIKPRVKSFPALNQLFGEISKSTYMELASIRNQNELIQLKKEITDKQWIKYIQTNTEEEYLSIVPELEKLITNLYFDNLENQYQKIKNNPFELKILLSKLEESKILIETNPLKYISNIYGDIKFSNSFIDIRKGNYYKIYNQAIIKQKENVERQKEIEEEFSYSEVFDENFEKNTNGWYEIEDQSAINKITNSKFVFENKTAGGYINLAATKLPALNQDFIISINTTWLNGIDNNSYHILWGANGFSNYFSFGITANGLYRYSNINNGNYQDVISLTASEHINRNGSNIISVRRNSDKIEFYINYFKVNELEYSEFYGDQIGLSVTGPQRIEFDDLKVAYNNLNIEEFLPDTDPNEISEFENRELMQSELTESDESNDEKNHDGYGPVIKDINGNKYKTVYIGSQHWMAENLKVSKYNDGTNIPNIIDKRIWLNSKIGAWCYYNNNLANNAKFGKLYNWYALSQTTNGYKNICPKGWHVPSDEEWTELINYLGGDEVAGDKLKDAGTLIWDTHNESATNSSLFTCLPGGYRIASGSDQGIGNYGQWWSSTENGTNSAWYRELNKYFGSVRRYENNKLGGNSVRCIRD